MDVAFALAAAVHAGFQVTVTVLVYPALLRPTDESAERWRAAHTRHTRAITPLVAVIYGALVALGVALVVAGPRLLGWVALTATALALGLTATVAGPIHGRLDGPDGPLATRLLRADRARCAAAVLAALAAAAGVLAG